MTVQEALEHIKIVVAPFVMIPVCHEVMVRAEDRDFDGTYFAVLRALDQPYIQRAGPLFTRLEDWKAAIATARKAA